MGAQMPEDSMNEGQPPEPVAVPPAEAVAGPPAGSHDLAEEVVVKGVVAETASVIYASVPVTIPEPVMLAMEKEARQPAAATIRLEKKHPLAIRWMHWVNFPVLFTMIWSGLVIYWNDSEPGWTHPHEVYRVGVGSLTVVHFFPEWFWKAINAPYHVTEGLGYHFFFAWIFALNGFLYVL